MRIHLLLLIVALAACASPSWHDADDPDFVPCTWTVELFVNGARIEDFRLACRRLVRSTTHPVIAHLQESRVSMLPGRYEVNLPDGRVERIAFPPGGIVHTRVRVQVRSVRFTMEQGLHHWLESQPGPHDPELSLPFRGADTASPMSLLAEALIPAVNPLLASLTPGSPVTVPLPPAVYGLHPGAGGNREINFGFPLDLTDPAVSQVDLTSDGWPGVRRYELTVTGDLEPWHNSVGGFSAWDSDTAYSVNANQGWVGFHPDGGVPIAVRVPGLAVIKGWMPPGRHAVSRDMVLGKCAVTLTNLGANDLKAYVSWVRAGVTFYRDAFTYVEQPGVPLIENMPAGPATLVIRRELRDQRVQFARVELDVSANTLVNAADLEWQRAGRVEFRLLSPGIEVISATHSLAGEVQFEEPDMPRRLTTRPLPPGDHRFMITVPGRAPHTRSIRVDPGLRTTIYLP